MNASAVAPAPILISAQACRELLRMPVPGSQDRAKCSNPRRRIVKRRRHAASRDRARPSRTSDGHGGSTEPYSDFNAEIRRVLSEPRARSNGRRHARSFFAVKAAFGSFRLRFNEPVDIGEPHQVRIRLSSAAVLWLWSFFWRHRLSFRLGAEHGGGLHVTSSQ